MFGWHFLGAKALESIESDSEIEMAAGFCSSMDLLIKQMPVRRYQDRQHHAHVRRVQVVVHAVYARAPS